MTLPAVSYRPPPNRLAFPFNVRSFLAEWKKLYFHPGAYRPDPAHDAQWNRGAYLAEGLGHCGSCHTPRNALGAEIRERHFDGGEAEGWHAYAINERTNAPTRWTVESLTAYLRDGWQAEHGVARGPMAGVTRELAKAGDADLRAMAVYIVSLMVGAPAAALVRPAERAAGSTAGAALYIAACARCHDGGEPLPFGGIPLERSIGVSGEDPRNLVNVILYGLPAADGRTGPLMPGYAGAISDAQLVELVTHLRARFSNGPAWRDVERVVREARAAGARVAMEPAGGTGTDPASITEER
jgi:mono/diheme cytochrome c family protein